MPTTDSQLFGRGVAFAPRLGCDGRMAWSSGHANVRDSIRVILLTQPGERVRLPAFGAGLRAFLFEPNIASTHRLIEQRITFALTRWEPRVALEQVTVARNDRDNREAVVDIRYRLVATGARDQIGFAVPVGG